MLSVRKKLKIEVRFVNLTNLATVKLGTMG